MTLRGLPRLLQEGPSEALSEATGYLSALAWQKHWATATAVEPMPPPPAVAVEEVEEDPAERRWEGHEVFEPCSSDFSCVFEWLKGIFKGFSWFLRCRKDLKGLLRGLEASPEAYWSGRTCGGAWKKSKRGGRGLRRSWS